MKAPATPSGLARSWIGLCLVALFACSTLSAQSQQPETQVGGFSDGTELETWFDGYMAATMRAHGIVGAAIAVVKDGAIFFSKGYGWADIENRRPVDPATTLFRIGSVSKLFTWTAVMQLRDEGRLDLDTDINEYLDFSIPADYPEPITIRHLLTHTPGFEDRAWGLFGPATGLPRGEWLHRNLPARVRPPGTEAAYSNYGSALAGYIVERRSGLPWEEYLEQRILEPLGMTSATGRQPLPGRLAAQMSHGFRNEGGRFAAKPFEWIEMAPAGSISASAEAMAAFMIAHLQGGIHQGVRILADSTTHEMHSRAHASDPRINGMALGFYEKSSHGLRIVGHSGGTQWFYTDLALIPSENVGIFISTNSTGGAALLGGAFMEALLDRYYPESPFAATPPAEGWDKRAKAYAGTYRSLRRSYTTFEKVIGPLFEVKVTPVAPGVLLLRSPDNTERFLEVAPGHLRAADRPVEVAFREDGRGGYSHLFLSTTPPSAAEKLRTWQTVGLHAVLLAFSMLLFVSTLLLVPVRYALKRNVQGMEPIRGAERALRWSALAFSALSISFLLIAGTALGRDAFMTGEVEGVLRVALLLPVVSLPLALVIVAGVVPAIHKRYWTTPGRVHYIIFSLAVIVFVVQLVYWNLLGWRI